MKNNYRKLRLSILLQSLLVTALAVLVGAVILEYLIDGVYNDSFAKIFVDLLVTFNVNEQTAIDLYWKWIGENKIFFLILGYLSLFALFFYFALTQMTKYLDQIGDGIKNILSKSEEPIRLIPELKPLEENLNQIKNTIQKQEQQALEIEQKKNDLVLFLAHDLKTPLTSVVAYLSMLDDNPDMGREDRIKYTRISLDKANRLGALINQFFQITKHTLEDDELELVELDLTMMLEQIADELYGVLQEKRLTCELMVEEDLMISADSDKLARVFDNILRNAIIYCDEESILKIKAMTIDGKVVISFENEGEVVSADKLERIFDKFYRGDQARSTSTGGAGLGLAIAKDIVEMHGGSISAETEGRITRFIVELPLEKGEEEDEVHTHSRRASWGISRGRKGLRRKSRKRDMEHVRKTD